MCGDSSHFTREDGVEETWRIVQPLLDAPPPVEPYKPGTWGPPGADKLVAGASALARSPASLCRVVAVPSVRDRAEQRRLKDFEPRAARSTTVRDQRCASTSGEWPAIAAPTHGPMDDRTGVRRDRGRGDEGAETETKYCRLLQPLPQHQARSTSQAEPLRLHVRSGLRAPSAAISSKPNGANGGSPIGSGVRRRHHCGQLDQALSRAADSADRITARTAADPGQGGCHGDRRLPLLATIYE